MCDKADVLCSGKLGNRSEARAFDLRSYPGLWWNRIKLRLYEGQEGSTLRGPAQLVDLQGAPCVPTYNLTGLPTNGGQFRVPYGGYRAPSPVQKSPESLQPQQHGNCNDDLPGRYTSPHGVSTSTPLNWLISRNWLAIFDPISSQLFRPSQVLSHTSRIQQAFAMRAYFNELFYKHIFRTSALSSTNIASILIFSSCVIGTCNILCGRVFSQWEGSCFVEKNDGLYILFFSTIMVGVGIFTSGG